MKKQIKKLTKHCYSRFVVVSFFVFLFILGTTIILTEKFQWDHNSAYIISLIAGITLLFILHEKITFKVTYSPRSTMFKRFVKLYITTYILNWIIVYFVSIKISYIIAIPIVTFILSLLTYKINKKYIFHNY